LVSININLVFLFLKEWEGRLNVGMSNSVTTEIRESVKGMSIGKTRTTEKADRATVEQVCGKSFTLLHVFVSPFLEMNEQFLSI
jgi:hypothetical protein